jgi:hypothetical protein
MYIHAYKKISCKSSDWQKKIEQCQEAEKKYRANWKSTHPPIKNQMVRPLTDISHNILTDSWQMMKQ